MMRSVVSAAAITTTIGVRQGSLSSCVLFVLFVKKNLIGIINARFGLDGIYGWLYVLMLMDNTVILCTIREGTKKNVNSVT